MGRGSTVRFFNHVLDMRNFFWTSPGRDSVNFLELNCGPKLDVHRHILVRKPRDALWGASYESTSFIGKNCKRNWGIKLDVSRGYADAREASRALSRRLLKNLHEKIYISVYKKSAFKIRSSLSFSLPSSSSHNSAHARHTIYIFLQNISKKYFFEK